MDGTSEATNLIKVEFKSIESKIRALKNSKNLKERFTDVYVNPDLTEVQRIQLKKAKELVKQKNNSLENEKNGLKYGLKMV